MRRNRGPIRHYVHENRDSTGGEILLVAEILIGRYEKIEACVLGRTQQIAMGKQRPAALQVVVTS